MRALFLIIRFAFNDCCYYHLMTFTIRHHRIHSVLASCIRCNIIMFFRFSFSCLRNLNEISHVSRATMNPKSGRRSNSRFSDCVRGLGLNKGFFCVRLMLFCGLLDVRSSGIIVFSSVGFQGWLCLFLCFE